MKKKEKFSIIKFFDFGGIAWATVLGLGVKVLIIVMIIIGGVAVKNTLFPTPTNINAPEITVKEGGKVTYNVTQGRKERAWWVPSPFVEVFTQADTGNEELGFGVRAGGRWDF